LVTLGYFIGLLTSILDTFTLALSLLFCEDRIQNWGVAATESGKYTWLGMALIVYSDI